MKIESAVRTETKKIAIGTGILSVLMLAVFLILGKFDLSVLLGALLGYIVAVGNFFLMAMTVQHVTNSMPVLPPRPQEEEADESEDEKKEEPLSDEARQAGKTMQASFFFRMLLIGAAAALAVSLRQVFNPWAALVSLLFPNFVITGRKLFQKEQKEASKDSGK
ncbi:MAG: hypothetical protein IK099_04625 [Clostridia bacterium]|nr:hypothetical protein [Clostridia bacterium]